MTARTKKLLLWLVAGAALLWLLVRGRAAYALATAPWRNSDTIDGFPNNTHWTPHFSYNEFGTSLDDGDFDAYLRAARYMEHIREARGGLPFVAHVKTMSHLPTDDNQRIVWIDTTLTPGQSLSQFSELVNDTVNQDAQAAGLKYSLNLAGSGLEQPILLPFPLLGL